jgi:hypothetical protein
MTGNAGRLIPAFLSFDVEPDAFQLDRMNPPTWSGYTALAEYLEHFRADLTARTGRTPKFGWFFRTDPQVAEIHGRPDHALVAFPERTARLQAAGDYFGVHAHLIRWSADRGLWVHDFEDVQWQTYATRFALDAFGRWAGAPARRFRVGAGFLTNQIVEAAEQAGVEVDLSLEPVTSWGMHASAVRSGVDSSPIVGAFTDCGGSPRFPYRPARHDFRIDAGNQGRRLLMVPLASHSLARRPLWRRAAGRLLHGRAPETVRMLYPAAGWPSPQGFWDLVQQQLRPMRWPYVSLAIRTDAAASESAVSARRILDALPGHPLAGRLLFEDPLASFRAVTHPDLQLQ